MVGAIMPAAKRRPGLLPSTGRVMLDSPPRSKSGNRLLSRLQPEDFRRLEPYLEAVELPLRQRLELRNQRIDHIYFIESGIASVVANGVGDHSVEVGFIGREGVTGLAVVMGAERTPHETFMQLAGRGQRLPASELRRAVEESPTLRREFLHYGYAFFVQTAHTAMINVRAKLDERLARWLLMAHDRVDGDELPLTHEFIAIMLGVRRPGVTVALNRLEKDGFIRNSRGVIIIVDRQGLEKSSNGAYGARETEFKRLFG